MTSEQKEREALKPCPFCGAKANSWVFPGENAYVCCSKCGGRCGVSYPHEEAAITAWNTRAHQAQPEGELVEINRRQRFAKYWQEEGHAHAHNRGPSGWHPSQEQIADKAWSAALSVIPPQPDAPALPWQPIETIPRDAEWVRLLNKHGKMDEGQWCGPDGFDLQDQLNTLHGEGDYTHWMPKCMQQPAEQAGGLTEEEAVLLMAKAHWENCCYEHESEYPHSRPSPSDWDAVHQDDKSIYLRDACVMYRALLAAMAKKAGA